LQEPRWSFINMTFEQEWLDKFKSVIIEYQKNRAPDPFMTWFKERNSEGFFLNDFERVLVILIDARFDQRTTAENALQNTKKVVQKGALKREFLSKEELPYLIPRQGKTAEKWADLFRLSLPKLHELAREIVSKTDWTAQELLALMQYSIKVPYLGVKTSRLAIRWLYELMPKLRIDMRNYKIPIDSLVYRVLCRLGIIDPFNDKYYGEDSPADLKAQLFAKRIFPDNPHLLDEPLWATGRQADKGGHCFPKSPNCNGCIFHKICRRKFINIDPSELGMYTSFAYKRTEFYSIPEDKSANKKAQFAKFVEELKQKGIKGKEYREKIMKWVEEHKNYND